MKIYSDKLTQRDLFEALPREVDIAVLETHARPRKRCHGWEVSLTGSSPFRSQMSGQRAATWDEHGLWMAELYRRDPNAVIGHYKTMDDFINQTRTEKFRARRNFNAQDNYRKTHRAPWLSHTGLFLS